MIEHDYIGDTKNLEDIERRMNGDTGYLPEDCDGLDCPHYYQCKSNPTDLDTCPFILDTFFGEEK